MAYIVRQSLRAIAFSNSVSGEIESANRASGETGGAKQLDAGDAPEAGSRRWPITVPTRSPTPARRSAKQPGSRIMSASTCTKNGVPICAGAVVQRAMEGDDVAHGDDRGGRHRLALDARQRPLGEGLADGQQQRADVAGLHGSRA
jgi:hypothetical protein